MCVTDKWGPFREILVPGCSAEHFSSSRSARTVNFFGLTRKENSSCSTSRGEKATIWFTRTSRSSFRGLLPEGRDRGLSESEYVFLPRTMATEKPEGVEEEAPAPVMLGMPAEVAGEERSLKACIDDGLIEKPRLMQWNEWRAWRKCEGRRPVYTWGRTPEGVAAQKALVQREVRLRKELMQHFYGDDWRDQLDARVMDEDPPEDAHAVALGEAPGSVGAPPASLPDDTGSLGALSAGSWPR